jgi:DNA polymerase elongation subunit (family B)
MADLLKGISESSDTYLFQLIDVKILDFDYPAFGYNDSLDIHGDDFIELTCDMEVKPKFLCDVALIGCTENGNSILVKVKEFKPYLFYKKTCSVELIRSKIASLLELRDEHVLTTKVVKCKNLYGWEPNSMENPTDRKEHEYVQVFFPNVRMMRKAIHKTQCHEGQITAETKFADSLDIVPSGWIEVKGERISKEESISHCKIEIECSMNKLKPILDKDDIAPLMVAAIDIECISSTGAFPEATNPGDIISMIGAVYWRIGMDKNEAISSQQSFIQYTATNAMSLPDPCANLKSSL